jgi:hypothetical protein
MNQIASHQNARSKPSKSKVMHCSYFDRDDLRMLAKCDNINGPICDTAHVTVDESKVTCKRCLRIMNGVAIRSRPYSDADYRLFARLAPKNPLPKPKKKAPKPG